MGKNMELSIEELRLHVSYDPETGALRWIKKGRGRNGEINHLAATGYLAVKIQGKSYLCHRLAWALHYGEFPPQLMDHIDGDRTNNKLSNLRLASISENNRNSSIRKNNKSGYKGVSWRKREKKWVASIRVDGHQINLGYHNTAAEASKAYSAASKKYHGEFGRST